MSITKHTATQRKALSILLNGGYMIDFTKSGMGYRIYDSAGNVLLKIYESSAKKLMFFIRKKDGKYIVDKKAIRSRTIRKNTWVKTKYRNTLSTQKLIEA